MEGWVEDWASTPVSKHLELLIWKNWWCRKEELECMFHLPLKVYVCFLIRGNQDCILPQSLLSVAIRYTSLCSFNRNEFHDAQHGIVSSLVFLCLFWPLTSFRISHTRNTWFSTSYHLNTCCLSFSNLPWITFPWSYCLTLSSCLTD